MRFHSWTTATLLCVLASGVSCTRDTPTTPPAITPPAQSASRTTVPSITIRPLKRSTALGAPQSASATIGVLGGMIALPDAGLTVVVPPLALASPTTITVTALAGADVAYEFAPHGLRFLAPIVATQQLHGTDAGIGGARFGQPLWVGYFGDATAITTVTELLTTNVNVLSLTSVASIWHFSGYVWSSGREEDAADVLSPEL